MNPSSSPQIYITYSAIEIRKGRWAVRPKDQLGTCGSWPAFWSMQVVNARSEEDALRIAHKKRNQ